MKKILIAFSAALFMISCGGPSGGYQPGESEEAGEKATIEDYDPHRGEGNFKDYQPPAKLDATMAANGEKVYDLKCASCHKLSAEMLVGPGWKGVTELHSPDWILNFMTNTDEMLDKDPKAQAMLEICMVRMPNQNLTDDDAKNVYEFMRKNDGVK
ncbi:MAG: cytochrome c [Chitinophagaceae bacterium]|nr:cytochrome c [Chitinophagaceae bacterium]